MRMIMSPWDAVGERTGWLLRNNPALPHGGSWSPAKLIIVKLMMIIVMIMVIMTIIFI